jgi:hypothetical protein
MTIRFQVSGFSPIADCRGGQFNRKRNVDNTVLYKRRLWPRASSLIIKKPCHFGVVSREVFTKNERRTSNIERPTSNNVFCQLKKGCAKQNHPSRLVRLWRILRFAYFRFDKAQRHQYSTFEVGRSMFDVQSFHCSGKVEFHKKLHTRCQYFGRTLWVSFC